MLSLRSYLLIGFLNLFTLPLYTGTTTFLYRKKILCQEISVIISWVLGLDWVLQTEDNRLKIFAKTDWNKSLSKWLGDRTEPSRFNLWIWLYFYQFIVWYLWKYEEEKPCKNQTNHIYTTSQWSSTINLKYRSKCFGTRVVVGIARGV